MTTTDDRPSARPTAAVRPGVAVVVLAVGSLVLGGLLPVPSPLLVALAVGAVVANVPAGRLVEGHEPLTRLGLRLGVVLLGMQVALSDVLALGPTALVVVAATVAVTFTATTVIGRRLGLDHDLVTLVAAGFSICGAAAIAAVNEAVRARSKDVAVAVALVTVFGTAMIGLVPWAAGALGLTDVQAATWAGASIHEVAQVAVAASVLGPATLAVAMTVKLGRVVLLAPVCAIVAGRRGGGSTSRLPAVPWFVVAFCAAVGLRSTGVLGSATLDVASTAGTLLLAAGMLGLGLGIRLRSLGPIEPRVLLLATLSTAVAAGTPLAVLLATG